MILLDGPDDLTAELYRRIVHGGEAIQLAEEALRRVERCRDLFLRHLDTGVVCYGVNTGLGALAGLDLGPEEIELLPRHVLLGRSAAIGPAYPAAMGRGALLVKLVQFLTGRSAVSAELCRFVADRLNEGLAPLIPSEGHGMAGEIVPLCHMAQTLIGEGFVLDAAGEPRPAAEWLRARGVAPYRPNAKEGLSLINGVAAGPALAFEAVDAIGRTLALATLTAAVTAEGLGASVESWSGEAAKLRPDPGMVAISAALAACLAGSQVVRATRQPPVSIRVVPQVHGAMLAALSRLEGRIVAEWRAIGDNPAFIADEAAADFGRLVHSGNFHCAELTGHVEAAALALAQVALLSERRLHRVLDARFSGLAPQLARRPGLDAGLVILHKAALGLTARLRSLAVPPSLQHSESSFGQEDFMTMTLPALDRLREIDRLAAAVLAYELYAALVAVDQRGDEPGRGVAAARAAVRLDIPAYAGDRPYGPEIDRLVAMIGAGRLPLPAID